MKSHLSLLSRRVTLAAVLGLSLLSPVQAGEFERGLLAVSKGDHEAALDIWRPLADGGDRRAQFGLGVAYYEGRGVPRDTKKAVEWFVQSADQGFAPAQFNLGNAYRKGEGVEKNLSQAAYWWKQSAEQGFVRAQFNLGTLYYFGRGVEADEEQAVQWFRRAAANGSQPARNILSKLKVEDVPGESAPEQVVAKRVAEPVKNKAEQEAPKEEKTLARVEPQPEAKPEPQPDEPTFIDEPKPQGSSSFKREPWLLSQDPNAYTIQLFAGSHEEGVISFIEDNDLSGPVAIFRSMRKGKPWYSVTFGVYPSASEARTTIDNLKATLSAASPWARKFKSVHKLIADASK